MKASKFFFFTTTLLVLVFNSCDKTDNSQDPSGSTATEIVKLGTWKITFFNDSGNDETSHFSGYSFTFNADGSVKAVKNTSTVTGTWNTGTDDSQNKFNLDFGSTTPFDELNEDWDILEKSALKIRLQHISGGNGGTDLLTFEKN